MKRLGNLGRIGALWTVAFGGGACLLSSLAFLAYLPRMRAHIRPLYIKMGIIKEVAAGLETADEPGGRTEIR